MITRFFGYYKPYRLIFLIDFVMITLVSLSEMIYPSLLRHLVDNSQSLTTLSTITGIGLILLAVVVLKGIGYYLITYLGSIGGSKIERDMRNQIFSHIIRLPVSFFDNNKSGNLLSYLGNDLEKIGTISHAVPENLLTSFILIVGSFVIVLTYNWILILCLVVFLPILILFTYRCNRKMEQSFMAVQNRIGEANGIISEKLEAVRIIKSFANEPYEDDQIGQANDILLETHRRSFKTISQFLSGSLFINGLTMVTTLLISAYFVHRGTLTIGQMVGTTFYSNLLIGPVNKIVNSTEKIQQGMASLKRFFSIIDQPVESDHSIPSDNLTSCLTGHIIFEDVTFGYTEQNHIMKNFNLEVRPGQTVAIVGPSGVGKTTLAHLLIRFYQLSTGRILIDGIDITTVPLTQLRRHIGIVPQDLFLFSGSIADNIRYGNPDGTYQQIINRAKDAYAHDFICQLDDKYETIVGERGVKLSGGQRQRISLARMFAKDPSILILDEATSALDNESEAIIKESVSTLSAGRTTFIISHRLSTIEHADHIVVMTKQGIIEQGSFEELMEWESYFKKLYQMTNG